MSIIRKAVVFLLIISGGSCNRNYYSTISPASFLKNGWYEFRDFKYQGTLSNGPTGLPSGNGTVIYRNGVIVNGNFVNGVLYDDKATFEIPGKGKITGRVEDGVLMYGVANYDDGSYYKGRFVSYQPHGKGMLISSNGDISIGEFKNGKLDGDGSYYSAETKERMVGAFSNGLPNGEIARIDAAKNISADIYENGNYRTEEKLFERAVDEVTLSEKKEIQSYTNIIGEREKESIQLKKDMEKKSEEYEAMEGQCRCILNPLCITRVPNDLERHSSSEYNFNVYLPYGASKKEVENAFKSEYQRRLMVRAECNKWKNDENYFSNAIFQYEEQYNSSINEIRSAIKAREAVEKRQAQERQNKIEFMKKLKAQELNDRIKKVIDQQNERCKLRPADCGCTSPEDLQKCARSKTPCACAI